MILGTIGTYTAGSGVTLTIDGEETPTTKDYKFLSSYSPVAGDRVLIEEISGTYVVLGKVVNAYADVPYATRAGTATSASSATTATGIAPYGNYGTTKIEFTIFNGNLWVRQGSSQWALAKG